MRIRSSNGDASSEECVPSVEQTEDGEVRKYERKGSSQKRGILGA
jgi:hypothetical protein